MATDSSFQKKARRYVWGKKPTRFSHGEQNYTHEHTHGHETSMLYHPNQICLGTHASYHGNLKGPVLQHTKTHGRVCTRRPPVMWRTSVHFRCIYARALLHVTGGSKEMWHQRISHNHRHTHTHTNTPPPSCWCTSHRCSLPKLN